MKPADKSTEQPAKLLMRNKERITPAGQEGLQERMLPGLQCVGFIELLQRTKSMPCAPNRQLNRRHHISS